MTEDTAEQLERLYHSSTGVVARVLECGRFSDRPGGMPRECIYDEGADDNVSVLSSYNDFVAASWLRHDVSRQLIHGELTVGLLLWSSADRGLAGARDLGALTQAAFEA